MKESLGNLAWEVAKKEKEKPGSKRGSSEPGGKCALDTLSLAVATQQRLPAGGASSSLIEGFQLRVSAMSSRLARNGMVPNPSLCYLLKR